MMTARFIITAVATLMCVSTYALTTPLDADDPMPAVIAAAERACAPSNVVNPTIAPIVAANADFIAACAREAGLTQLPILCEETPAMVEWMHLESARMRQGWTDQLMRDYRAFFAKIKNQ